MSLTSSPIKRLFVALAGALALIYLLNPGFGVFELLPDNIPLVGNLDEATASMVLLGAMRFFGWDLTAFFRKRTTFDLGNTGH